MTLSVEEVEAAILEKAAKWYKPQLYIKDFRECDPDRSLRDIKNIANGLVMKNELMFWCTGTAVMYVIPDRIKNEQDEN